MLCRHLEVEVNLRLTVSPPACLGVRHPSGTHNQLFFQLEISFRQLWLCYFCSTLSDEKTGSVIYCTIASGPCQSSHSWVEVPQNSWPYFTVSSETPPTWKARSPYLYPPGTGWPCYTSGHWVPFYDSQGYAYTRVGDLDFQFSVFKDFLFHFANGMEHCLIISAWLSIQKCDLI
jgi:hypothetical protein